MGTWVPTIHNRNPISAQMVWLVQILPVEFHIMDVLKSIANAIGKFSKADLKGAELNRASFAMICCQVNENSLIPTSMWIGRCKQPIIASSSQFQCPIYLKSNTPNHPCQKPTNPGSEKSISPTTGNDQRSDLVGDTSLESKGRKLVTKKRGKKREINQKWKQKHNMSNWRENSKKGKTGN